MFWMIGVLFAAYLTGGLGQIGEVQEICNMETFEAECGEQEVILMQTARYGRMRLGKCVETNYGNIGCMTDVLMTADARCSGQRRCSIKLPDDSLMAKSTCPKDVTPYLETSYICLPVIQLSPSKCREAPVILTKQHGFLTPINLPPSSPTSLSSSVACTVVIRVSPGQRINVTLFDFGTSTHAANARNSGGSGAILCQKYATIREDTVPKDAVVCSGQHRVRNVFVSDSHEIKVSLVPYAKHQQGMSSRFVLQYEALGCPVPQLSSHHHVTVSNDNAVVTCNSTGEKWYLVCRDAKWVGVTGRCAQMQVQDDSDNLWSVLTNDWTTPYGILIVIGLGVGLGVVIGVVLLIGVLFCMKRYAKRDRNMPPPPGPIVHHELEPDSCTLSSTLRKTYCPLPVSHHQTYDDSPDLYSWRGGLQHPDDICGGNNNRGVTTRVTVRQPGGGSGNSGGVELVTGTCPRKAKDGSHLYETPK